MAYDPNRAPGTPPGTRPNAVPELRSRRPLVIVALLALVALLAVFTFDFSADHSPAPAEPKPASAPAEPVVPDAAPSTVAPDATAPSGAESDVGDPTVPGVPAEDAAPAN